MADEEDITDMHAVVDALVDAIATADPAKRQTLAAAMDGYHDDFPDEWHWAAGGQAPALLHHVFMAIDMACRPEFEPKPGRVIRLAHRKPEGNA
jgi:hypothetical protein